MFGMSVFQSVLERFKAEENEATTEDETPSVVSSGISAPFVGTLTAAGNFGTVVAHHAYLENAGEEMLQPPKPKPKPVIPDHLRRTNPDMIAADLGLGDNETTLSLTEKRRRFAAENHPDRYPLDFRAHATLRMKVANMLIDEALRRLKIMAPKGA
ncbi:hypothetical protein QO002_003471 [Pararhizobium capsulatum DSM 1112]|uniref:J domain-containing protein n=1 Tax=Pararhizobium capsulatum DSM 1112 TaxID=1121113 RepID=A0ABU0BSU4_9HYPH|nr:hypothetical protein [Pararhizobium capsulatum]MDQ0321333.1 hypothetical protein [Pararhizobium capsulatum DSM 1112]